MKKIAILFDGDLKNRKGLVNAVLNRVIYLKRIADYDIDVYCLQGCHCGFNRIIRGRQECDNRLIEIEGLSISLIRYPSFAIDDVLSHRLYSKPILFDCWVNNVYSRFKGYSLISTHGLSAGKIGQCVKHKCGIPYCVTWHGTDIHTFPFQSKYQKIKTKKMLQDADMNFFVSKSLQDTAAQITSNFSLEVLYNGVGANFKVYSVEKRLELRKKYDVFGKKVVVFAGNLVPVKNVMVLPFIFAKVKSAICNDVAFWVIGDGYQKELLQKSMNHNNIECVFWGNQPASVMPDFFNCSNVLILSSLNEGLSLVLLEAISCGANAVGSSAGGIPEAIGRDNCFDLDANFVDKISNRIIYMLNNDVKQKVLPQFHWDVTAEKENYIYKKLIL